MAKLIKVSVYESIMPDSSRAGNYRKIKEYYDKEGIPYCDRVAYTSTGDRVVETKIPLKQVKKMANELGLEYRILF